MILSCPTLLFTPNKGMLDDLKRQAGSSLEYLTHAPTWEAFNRLVAQIAFGLVVVDFAVFIDDFLQLAPFRVSDPFFEIGPFGELISLAVDRFCAFSQLIGV